MKAHGVLLKQLFYSLLALIPIFLQPQMAECQIIETYQHQINWGIGEVRLTRFLDFEALLTQKYGSYNAIPPSMKTKYINASSAPAKMVIGRTKALQTVLAAGINDFRMTYSAPIDGYYGVVLQDFMIDDPNDPGTDIEPKEFREQLPGLLVNTYANVLKDFNILHCFNDIPYDINSLNGCLNKNVLLSNNHGIHDLTLKMQALDSNIIPDYKKALNDYGNFSYNKFHPDFLDISKYTVPQGCDTAYNFNRSMYLEYIEQLGDTFTHSVDAYNRPLIQKIAFEFGNEPDIPINFWGTPAQFSDLANAVHQRLNHLTPRPFYIGGYSQYLATNYHHNSNSPSNGQSTEQALVKKYYEEMANFPITQLSYHIYSQPRRWSNQTVSNSSCPDNTVYISTYRYAKDSPPITNADFWLANESGYAFPSANFDAAIDPSNLFTGDQSNTVINYDMSQALISEWNIGTAITEYGTCGDGDTATSYNLDFLSNYMNSPRMVYELGRLLLHASKHQIQDIYIHNLFDGGREQIGFFTQEGDPKGMWYFFSMVMDVVREGYTLNKYSDNGNNIQYIEVISNQVYTESFPTGYYQYKKVMQIQFVNNFAMPELISPIPYFIPQTDFVDYRFRTDPTAVNENDMGAQGCKFYRKITSSTQTTGWASQLPVLEAVPNPVACGHVLLRWQHVPPSVYTMLLEVRNMNSGVVVHTNPLQPGTTQQALNVCNFSPGIYVTTLFENGVPVARGRLMVRP